MITNISSPYIRAAAILLPVLSFIIAAIPARANRIYSPVPPKSPQSILTLYMNAITEKLPEKPRAALQRIPDVRRRLLAMKYYLHRDEEEINRKWAWSQEEASRYRKSDEYSRAMAEVKKVQQKFAELNPGYQLAVDIEIRSLSSQIGKWNSVRSIGEGAAELMATSLSFITDSLANPEDPLAGDAFSRFLGFLRGFTPERHPTVAVPGLSQHGQLRAFDFRIRRGGKVIAGASTSTISSAWDKAGWTAKLCEAILASSSERFEGPLLQPYEPWHYEYRP